MRNTSPLLMKIVSCQYNGLSQIFVSRIFFQRKSNICYGTKMNHEGILILLERTILDSDRAKLRYIREI